MLKTSDFEYELIDCGNGRRIEKFGEVVIDRPCPQALWSQKLNNEDSDAFFERERNKSRWVNKKNIPENWEINIGKIKAELRFSKNGQVGIFPEQFDNWQWISEKVSKKIDKPLKILNTFAYSGIATLFASSKHTEVCHVDGAKSALNWAQKNAELSGLSDRKIRWICDDVQKFMTREIRRGKKYDGIILDPPAFGRGKKQDWKIEQDLPKLMKLVEEVLTDKPLFVILTCHAPEFFTTEDLARILEKIPQFSGQKAEKLILKIPSPKGNSLVSSFGARICF